MKRLYKNPYFFIVFFILIGLLFVYRQVIFEKKILFPSNFLAQVYSPWRTEKFSGWEAGIPHKPIGDDQIRLFYPERTFANQALASKTIPLWNPYNFAGTPFLADFQSSIFYPLNILYFFIPQLKTWEFLQFIQPIMAAIFMYLFLSHFRLKKPAIWIGTIAFGFSGFMTVWSQEHVAAGQAALWLPLVLFGIEGYLKNKKLWYYCISIIALACSIFGGFIQITFYVFLFSFLYGLFRIKTLRLPFIRYMFKITGIYIFAVCISAIQLIPSIEAFLESPRSTSSAWYLFEGYLLPITHLFNAFVPDIFGNPGAYNFFGRGFYRETILYAGSIPLIFAIYASFKGKINPVISFFSAATIITFFLTLDSPFTRWFFQLPIPLLPTFLPSRILIITAFSVATLSSFGLSVLIERKNKNDRKLILSIISVFYIVLMIIFLYGILLLNYGHTVFFQQLNDYIIRHGSSPTKENILVLLKNLVLPFIMLSSLSFLLFKKIFNLSILGIIILTIIGQFYFLNKYLVVGDSQFLYPKNAVLSFLQSKNSLNRFLTFRQPMEENISTYTRIYSVEGANPVFPRRYGELLFAVKNNGKIAKDIPRIEARLSELGDDENPFEDIRRMRLFSLLGIKYILYFDNHNLENSNVNKFPQDLFKPIWKNGYWHGLEYEETFPRVFLANSIHIQNDPQKILDLVFDPKVNLLTTVVLEEKPKKISSSYKIINLSKPSIDSFVNIVTYKPEEIIIHAKTSSPQILFLSDNYYPGWKAYVDNRETKIYRTNYTFRSIYLTKGDHKVTFIYKPFSFQIGLIISFLSVLLLIIFVFYPIYTRNRVFINFRNRVTFFKK